MKTGHFLTGRVNNQRGAVAVIVAVAALVLISFVAFSIDIGYLSVTRNELQNIADASALSGARMLGRLYECDDDVITCANSMTYEDQQDYVPRWWTIWWAIADTARRNKAAEKDGIRIRPADIVIGDWDWENHELIDVATGPDAVQVTARRDGSANSPITTFFAGVMGIDAMNVSAQATAALSGLGSVPEAALPIPVAINEQWMSTVPCDEDLRLYPSSEETCAAWHTYDGSEYSDNANDMRRMIEEITAENYESPETIAGETQYLFNNGTLANLFTSDAMQNLFHTMRVKNDGVLDNDENSDTWTTAVAVYDGNAECNPSGEVTIVGFATVVITEVLDTPDKLVVAEVVCGLIDSGKGGGTYYGTLAAIPGLVE